jgi:hypothetical protein
MAYHAMIVNMPLICTRCTEAMMDVLALGDALNKVRPATYVSLRLFSIYLSLHEASSPPPLSYRLSTPPSLDLVYL